MQNFLLFLLCRLTDLYYICWKESFNKEIMQLIDGKAISEQVKQEIAAEVAEIVAKRRQASSLGSYPRRP